MLSKLREMFPGAFACTIVLSLLMIVGGIAWAGDSEEIELVLGIVLAILGIFVIINYIIAGYFYFAAVDKGYTDGVYFVVPFLFGVIGYLLVIALPNKNNILSQNENDTIKKPEVDNTNYFCTNCAKVVPYGITKCDCGQTFDWDSLKLN